ncbi:hypothetical protein C2G38_2184048 [Gigaspora rosea]|uniref:Uncharacterized protein n=1 Tax=Gigaspora rosea TaxID=44941 RepID=A0A397V9N3_9GLOM|nr:hypothetical protein C2G38_2184048 [Gigaspora rosea]
MCEILPNTFDFEIQSDDFKHRLYDLESILEKINGVFTFDQISPQSSAVFGIIFKGIDENSPEDYFIRIDNVTTVSFEKLAITIDPPKAGPWNVTLTGNVTKLVGLKFAVLKNDTVLDSTIIERYA